MNSDVKNMTSVVMVIRDVAVFNTMDGERLNEIWVLLPAPPSEVGRLWIFLKFGNGPTDDILLDFGGNFVFACSDSNAHMVDVASIKVMALLSKLKTCRA